MYISTFGTYNRKSWFLFWGASCIWTWQFSCFDYGQVRFAIWFNVFPPLWSCEIFRWHTVKPRIRTDQVCFRKLAHSVFQYFSTFKAHDVCFLSTYSMRSIITKQPLLHWAYVDVFNPLFTVMSSIETMIQTVLQFVFERGEETLKMPQRSKSWRD